MPNDFFAYMAAKDAELSALPLGQFLKAEGFELYANGGGLVAWYRKRDGLITFITDFDADYPIEGEPMLVGYYHEGADGEWADTMRGDTVNTLEDLRSLLAIAWPVRQAVDALEPEELGKAFSTVLRRWLDNEQMAEVVARNAAEEDTGICHSHDFCDANMAMLEALAALTGKTEDELTNVITLTEAGTSLWNAAWNAAHAAEFAI